MTNEIPVTYSNLNDYFSELEFFLNSFFDDSYAVKPMIITLTNEAHRIVYQKTGVSYFLRIYVLKPVIDDRRYTIEYQLNDQKLNGKNITPTAFTVVNL